MRASRTPATMMNAPSTLAGGRGAIVVPQGDTGHMPYRTAEPHPWLIAHHVTQPRRPELLPQPVPTRCTAHTYGGDLVTVEGVVTHRAEGGKLLAFAADYEGFGEWIAWVRRECCEPL